MAKNIENHVAQLDLDASGFLKGADQVLKSIEQVQNALEFKGAEKGAENIAAAMSKAEGAVSGSAQGILSSMRGISDGMVSSFANTGAAVAAVVNGSLASVQGAVASASSNIVNVSAATGEQVASVCQSTVSAVETAAAQCSASVSNAAAGIASSVSGSASGIGAAVQNASNASQATVGAGVAGVISKIASVIKVVPIVAAVGAAVAAAVALSTIDVRGKISEAMDNIHQKITEKIASIKTSIHNGLSNITESVSNIVTKIATGLGKAAAAIEAAVKPVIQGIEDAMTTAFPRTTKLVQEWAAEISRVLKENFDELKKKLEEFAAPYQEKLDLLKGKIDEIKSKFEETTDKVKGWFDHGKKSADEAADSFDKVGTAAENASSGIESITDASENAASGLNEMGGAADEALGKTATDAANAADATEEVSDASENAASGLNEMGGAADEAFGETTTGAKESADATEEVGESAEKGKAGFKELMEQAKEAFKEAKTGAENASKATEQVGEKASETSNKITDAIKAANSKLGEFLKSLGKDIGGIPFKMDEIEGKSKLVAAGITLVASTAKKHISEWVSGLKEAKDASESVDDTKSKMQDFGSAVETVSGKFSALGAVAFGALERIGQKAADTGMRLIKSLSVDQISQGWGEYELKMGSIQTIMSGTGESLATVNQKLDELNTYADKTIYSFSDMTSNIGKFTNQGVKLDDAVEAIQGISNAAALAGANSQQASHAMYNFAQALSQGYVMNIDWKSIENAMMATTEFKEELIKTGLELKKLKKEGDKVVSLTTDNNGHVSEEFNALQGFRDSLKSQWLTNEVLIGTLRKYSDETTNLGQRAIHAAQDVKTASQLMDTLKEAVGSGWAKTFEIIIGDFEEAKKLWTGVNNLISPILDGISDARNGLLEGWKTLGGRDDLIGSLKSGFENLVDIIKAAKEGLETLLPPITATKLKELTDGIGTLIDKVKLSKAQLEKVKDIFVKVGDGITIFKNGIKDVAEKISDFVKQTGALDILKERINDIFGGKDIFTKNGLLDAISDIVSKLNGLVQSNVIQTLKAHAEDIGRVIESVVRLGSVLAASLEQVFSSFGSLLGSVIQTISAHIGDIGSVIEGAVQIVSGALQVVSALISAYLNSWSSWLPSLLELVLSAVGKIGEALTKLGRWLSDNAQAIAGFIKGIMMLKTLGKVVGIVLKFAAAIKVVVGAISALKSLPAIIEILQMIGAASPVIGALTGSLSALGGILVSLYGPILAVVAGIVAVTAAVIALKAAEQKHQAQLKAYSEALYGLTDRQKEFAREVETTAKAYQRNNEVRKDTVEQVNKEAASYQRLVSDLRECVDADGKVKKGKEQLASYIIGELNKALGLEIELVDGQISGYGELNGILDETIEKKRILAMINAGKEEYDTAVYKQPQLEAGEARANRDLKDAEQNLSNELDTLSDLVFQHNEEIESTYGKDSPLYIKNPNDREEILNAAKNRVESKGGLGDQIEQTLSNIETLETQINVGTADVPSLKETAINAHEANIENAAVINNYGNLKESLDGTPEEQEQAIVESAYNVKHAEDNGVTLADLRKQKNTLQQEHDDRMESVKDGLVSDQESYMKDISTALDVAQEEYAKKFEEALSKKDRSDPEVNAVLSANARKAYAERQKAEKEKEEQKKNAGKWKEPFSQKKVEFGTEKTNTGFKKLDEMNSKLSKMRKESVEEAEKAAKETAATVSDAYSDGIFTKTASAAEIGGEEFNKYYANSITENSDITKSAGGSLPKTAAKEATDNASVVGPAGAAGTGEYAGSMKAESGQASDAGGALVSAAEMRAEAQAPEMAAPGKEGADQYAGGVNEGVPNSEEAAKNNADAVIEQLSAVEAYELGLAKGLEWGAGLEEGMAQKIAAVSAMAQQLVDMINKTTGWAMNTGSPSKVAMQFGNWWGEGLVIGMEELERAVKAESMTLSETMISGVDSFGTFHDILNGDYTDVTTATPVLDLSNIQNGAGQLRDMLDAAANVKLGGIDISGLFPDRAQGSSAADDRTLQELQGLRQDMAKFNEQLGRLQVRMDTGALVGTLADPMDAALGQRATIRGRR